MCGEIENRKENLWKFDVTSHNQHLWLKLLLCSFQVVIDHVFVPVTLIIIEAHSFL